MQNLCTTAAYRPVRELIQQERLKKEVTVQFVLKILYNSDYGLIMLTSGCCVCYFDRIKSRKLKLPRDKENNAQ